MSYHTHQSHHHKISGHAWSHFLVTITQKVYCQYLVCRSQGLIPYNAHNNLHHKNYLPQILMTLSRWVYSMSTTLWTHGEYILIWQWNSVSTVHDQASPAPLGMSTCIQTGLFHPVRHKCRRGWPQAWQCPQNCIFPFFMVPKRVRRNLALPVALSRRLVFTHLNFR